VAEQQESRPPQPEALDLVRRFRARFPAWADQVQQQAQADTNAPTLTPEARAEIEQLAEETEGLQTEALRSPDSRPYQRHALDNLLRIRELLPKQQQSGQAAQPPPEQQPRQQSGEQEQQPQEQPQQQPEEKPGEQPEEKPEPPRDVQELLRRALEREKEHEEEKRQRMRDIPLAPGERDW